jgi:hypothetical protein
MLGVGVSGSLFPNNREPDDYFVGLRSLTQPTVNRIECWGIIDQLPPLFFNRKFD